jgi:hypothetical protein
MKMAIFCLNFRPDIDLDLETFAISLLKNLFSRFNFFFRASATIFTDHSLFYARNFQPEVLGTESTQIRATVLPGKTILYSVICLVENVNDFICYSLFIVVTIYLI